MKRDDSSTVYSNRPASRRLHRRLTPSRMLVCNAGQGVTQSSPAVVSRLPENIVREAGMFELLAAEYRIAELEKALAEAQEAAQTDPLTGALNRRGFDQACQRELSRALRHESPLTVIHLDIDDFKQLNDTLGHQAGDSVLLSLVDLLHKSMRPSDVLCRFGGEEFVMLLPETSLEDARSVAARFLADFSALCISGIARRVTFSAGVVLLAAGEFLPQAIRRADAATYLAKKSGKNRIVAS